MAIKVNLDVLMAQKKKGLTELAKELDITKSCLTHRCGFPHWNRSVRHSTASREIY